MIFTEREKKHYENLVGMNYFEGDKGGGTNGNSNTKETKSYPHILKDATKNLYKDIRGNGNSSVINYFDRNGIKWHKTGPTPPGDTISSQVACMNHLFPIRNDKGAVLAIANGMKIMGKDDKFRRVLPLAFDNTEPAYISFEVVSKQDNLNEGLLTRGLNCTSIDAVICAEEDNKERTIWLILFEWKYTEKHDSTDYSNEDRDGEPKGANGKGIERMGRYGRLIDNSQYLCQLGGANPLSGVPGGKYYGSVLFKDDFYQLMRQTLWAEQMIKKENEKIELIAKKGRATAPATDFFHIHIIPDGNTSMLRGGSLATEWNNCLSKQGKERYKIMDPKELFRPIIESRRSSKYADLIEYLRIRYW